MSFMKTLSRSRRRAGDTATTVQARVGHSRHRAAGVLSRTASRVRHGSKTASRAIERGGYGVAGTLDGAAQRIGPEHHGLTGYFRRHPGRVLVVAAVALGLGALLLARRASMAMPNGDL